MKTECYFIYILECSNGAYYTGYTTDIERRYQEHQEGLAKCKYTRSFPPKRLVKYWKLEVDLSTVLKIEYAIKRLSKQKKQWLIKKSETLLELLDPKYAKGHRPSSG